MEPLPADIAPRIGTVGGGLRLAVGTALFCALAAALYAVAEVPPSPLVTLFFTWAPAVATILWLQRDVHRTGVGAVYDLGFLLVMASVVFIPWYVWKTRGRSGWRLGLLLYALLYAASIGQAFAGLFAAD